jgi:hypothetical protein
MWDDFLGQNSIVLGNQKKLKNLVLCVMSFS